MSDIVYDQIGDDMKQMFEKIMNISCPVLDIECRCGSTGYLDMINQSEVNGSMMKGADMYGRRFIVWKAIVTIEIPDGKHIVYPTFSTFFKRYRDDTSVTYHMCGHDGHYLFETFGGTDLKQLKFLYNLLSTGYAVLDRDSADAIRLTYPYKLSKTNSTLIFKISVVDCLDVP